MRFASRHRAYAGWGNPGCILAVSLLWLGVGDEVAKAMSGGEMAVRVEKIRSELGVLVGEPVLEFGSFAAPGYIYSGRRRGGMPGTTVWHSIASRFRRGSEGRMPLQLFLVLTGSRIVAVSMETSWRSGRAGFPIEVVRAWARSSTTVELASVPDGLEVRLIEPGGETTRLHSADLGRGFNDPLLSALGT
jgi:hypothetical protein